MLLRANNEYSGREAPSLKMGSVWFSYYFLGGQLLVFMLIGWHAANNHVLCSWAKYSCADDMVQELPSFPPPLPFALLCRLHLTK